MRDALPRDVKKVECAIINLDDRSGKGTHWVAYWKKNHRVFFYDSFGLAPPSDLIRYWGKGIKVLYNYRIEQRMGSVNCGHLVLRFLLSKCRSC